MKIDLHNYVVLRADFHRPESIGEPSGEELAAILATGLPKRGVEVGKSEAGDIAYYLECRANGSPIELMVGAEVLDDATDDRWYIQPREKRKSLFASKASDQDYRELLLAVNDVLHDCERISDIRWYPSFKTPEYLALMPTSRGPIPEPDYFDAMHPLIRFDWRLKQATSLLISPMGVVGFLVLACVLPLAIPQLGIHVVTVFFFGVIALMTFVPLVLSLVICREANRFAKLKSRITSNDLISRSEE